MRILFVSADPHWTERLDLGDELRELLHSLKGVNVMLCPAAQLVDLQRAIVSNDVDIVHFSGHASKDGLYFRDSEGLKQKVKPTDLSALFKNKGIKLAVLNACSTGETAEKLSNVVPAVIGTRAKLDDRAAKLMTKVLYSTLGKGVALDQAFEDATAAITDSGLENVYVRPEGSRGDEILFPKDAAFEGAPNVEGQGPYDKYFYVSYLDDQIDALTRNVRLNRWLLGGLLALALVVLGHNWWVHLWGAGQHHLLRGSNPLEDLNEAGGWGHAWTDVKLLFPWLRDVFIGAAAQSKGDTPLLDWLMQIGDAIPLLIASIQQRWLVHGNEKLRELNALKELVKNSEEISMTLQTRLNKILDQSVAAADKSWKPVSALLSSILEKIPFFQGIRGAEQT